MIKEYLKKVEEKADYQIMELFRTARMYVAASQMDEENRSRQLEEQKYTSKMTAENEKNHQENNLT